MFHSFTRFHRYAIAAAALFLSGKIEEQPRRLEHVIKVAHCCMNPDQPLLDPISEDYKQRARDLVHSENILLGTLGFDFDIDHPNAHVVNFCRLINASKELAQTAYFLTTSSLHLTTMCLRHPPKLVACVCIHLACQWIQETYKIRPNLMSQDWFMHSLGPSWRMDQTSTLKLMDDLKEEFLDILKQFPSTLKRIHPETDSRKRHAEEKPSNNVKIRKQEYHAPASQNSDLSENKSLTTQNPSRLVSISHTCLPVASPSIRPVAVVLPSTYYQESICSESRTQKQQLSVTASLCHCSQSQYNTHQSSKHSKIQCPAELKKETVLQFNKNWTNAQLKDHNNITQYPLDYVSSTTSTKPQKVQKTRSIFDIDSPLPFEHSPFIRRGPTGTAPRITQTPLKERLFGSAMQS